MPAIARYAKATFRKDRRLNIRLSSKDLEAIQKHSARRGVAVSDADREPACHKLRDRSSQRSLNATRAFCDSLCSWRTVRVLITHSATIYCRNDLRRLERDKEVREAIDIDNGVGKRLRRFLRRVVSDAAGQEPVRIACPGTSSRTRQESGGGAPVRITFKCNLGTARHAPAPPQARGEG